MRLSNNPSKQFNGAVTLRPHENEIAIVDYFTEYMLNMMRDFDPAEFEVTWTEKKMFGLYTATYARTWEIEEVEASLERAYKHWPAINCLVYVYASPWGEAELNLRAQGYMLIDMRDLLLTVQYQMEEGRFDERQHVLVNPIQARLFRQLIRYYKDYQNE